MAIVISKDQRQKIQSSLDAEIDQLELSQTLGRRYDPVINRHEALAQAIEDKLQALKPGETCELFKDLSLDAMHQHGFSPSHLLVSYSQESGCYTLKPGDSIPESYEAFYAQWGIKESLMKLDPKNEGDAPRERTITSEGMIHHRLGEEQSLPPGTLVCIGTLQFRLPFNRGSLSSEQRSFYETYDIGNPKGAKNGAEVSSVTVVDTPFGPAAFVCDAGGELSKYKDRGNEDSIGIVNLPDRTLVQVADGMGGLGGGDIASGAVVDFTLEGVLGGGELTAVLKQTAHGLKARHDSEIVRAQTERLRLIKAGAIDRYDALNLGIDETRLATANMGSTFAAYQLFPSPHEGMVTVERACAGDSPIWALRPTENTDAGYEIVHHSADDTIAPQQARFHSGRSIITNCARLSVKETAYGPEVRPTQVGINMDSDTMDPVFEVPVGTLLISATDGLSDVLMDDEIVEIARRAGGDPALMVSLLKEELEAKSVAARTHLAQLSGEARTWLDQKLDPAETELSSETVCELIQFIVDKSENLFSAFDVADYFHRAGYIKNSPDYSRLFDLESYLEFEQKRFPGSFNRQEFERTLEQFSEGISFALDNVTIAVLKVERPGPRGVPTRAPEVTEVEEPVHTEELSPEAAHARSIRERSRFGRLQDILSAGKTFESSGVIWEPVNGAWNIRTKEIPLEALRQGSDAAEAVEAGGSISLSPGDLLVVNGQFVIELPEYEHEKS